MKELGPDYYNITDLLTDEEMLIQKTANDFVQNDFKPLIKEHYENGTFPIEKDLIEELNGLDSDSKISLNFSGPYFDAIYFDKAKPIL